MKKEKRIWRCDLKEPCIKACESENDKHLCGVKRKDERKRMKIINLDELELKCIEFGIKNNLFTKEELSKNNLFTIILNGRYNSKTCGITFKSIENETITFSSETWENLYYQLECFFRETWNYIEDNNKMPLYMKIAEMISKQSKNGFISVTSINSKIREML